MIWGGVGWGTPKPNHYWPNTQHCQMLAHQGSSRRLSESIDRWREHKTLCSARSCWMHYIYIYIDMFIKFASDFGRRGRCLEINWLNYAFIDSSIHDLFNLGVGWRGAQNIWLYHTLETQFSTTKFQLLVRRLFLETSLFVQVSLRRPSGFWILAWGSWMLDSCLLILNQ